MNRAENPAIKNMSVKQFLIKYGIFLVIILLIILFSFSNAEFFTLSNFMLMFQQLSPFGIAVIGMIFVLLTGGIDISVGRVMFVSCVVVGEAIRALPESIIASPLLYVICFGIVITIGAVFGLVNGLLITKLRIYPFLATLVTGYIARGIGLTLAGADKYNVSAIADVTNGRIAGINPRGDDHLSGLCGRHAVRAEEYPFRTQIYHGGGQQSRGPRRRWASTLTSSYSAYTSSAP